MALTPKQLAMRRNGIGASEIAALAGASKWSTPIEIYGTKVLGLEKDQTLAMELGDLFEEPLAKLYARRTNKHLVRCTTLAHPERDFAMATPDRLVFLERVKKAEAEPRDCERLLQLKSTTWRMKPEWGEAGTDAVPDEYLCQVTWEMGVTGVKLCDVGVLFDKEEFRIYHVPFRERLWEALLTIGERFMVDHVRPRRPPPPDASDQYAEYLKQAFPKEKTQIIKPATPEIETVAHSLFDVEDRIKSLTSAANLHKNQLRTFIGDDTGTFGSFGKITYKRNKDVSSFDALSALAETKAQALDLISQLEVHVGAEEAEQRRKIIASVDERYTQMVPGPRVLRKSWTKELKATAKAVNEANERENEDG